jgi:hypothetical protein
MQQSPSSEANGPVMESGTQHLFLITILHSPSHEVKVKKVAK